LNVEHGDRIDSRERFVEQHELGIEHQRPRDLDTAPLPTGERVSAALRLCGQVELLEEPLQPPTSLGAIGLHGLEDRGDVLGHREVPEDRGFLRQVRDSKPRAPEHRKLRDVGRAEVNPAGRGADAADDHVEGGGLAGAVRAEQTHDLSPPGADVELLDHVAFAVALGETASR
jgi:hypothetical protein